MCAFVVHLGADDSLGGSLNVGRQTKKCRSVILWETIDYGAVVLQCGQMEVIHRAKERESVGNAIITLRSKKKIAFPDNTYF